MQVKDENKAELTEVAKKLVEYSLNDAGNIAYDVFESATRPDVLMICETWKDAESLEAHSQQPHFKELVPRLRSLATMKTEKFVF